MRVQELWARLGSRIRQKLCRHEAIPQYRETRNDFDGRIYWGASYVCPLCDEILHVEASISGEREALERAVEEGAWR